MCLLLLICFSHIRMCYLASTVLTQWLIRGIKTSIRPLYNVTHLSPMMKGVILLFLFLPGVLCWHCRQGKSWSIHQFYIVWKRQLYVVSSLIVDCLISSLIGRSLNEISRCFMSVLSIACEWAKDLCLAYALWYRWNPIRILGFVFAADCGYHIRQSIAYSCTLLSPLFWDGHFSVSFPYPYVCYLSRVQTVCLQ